MREDEDVKAVRRSHSPLATRSLADLADRDAEPLQFLSKAIDPPKVDQLNAAWKTLVDLQAVEGEDSTSRLTALGRHVRSARSLSRQVLSPSHGRLTILFVPLSQMSSIPVDLRLAKMLVLGAIFRCLDPILSITAILSSKPLFLSPLDKRNEAQKCVLPLAAASVSCSPLTLHHHPSTGRARPSPPATRTCSRMPRLTARRPRSRTTARCAASARTTSSARRASGTSPRPSGVLLASGCGPLSRSCGLTSAPLLTGRLRTDFMGALKELGFLPSSRTVSAELNENSGNENLLCVLFPALPRPATSPDGRSHSHPFAVNRSFSAACILGSQCVFRTCLSSPVPRTDLCSTLPCQRVDLPKAKFDQMMSGTILREHAAKEIKFFDATERVFLHPVRRPSTCTRERASG